jgi:hypothetical protein
MTIKMKSLGYGSIKGTIKLEKKNFGSPRGIGILAPIPKRPVAKK